MARSWLHVMICIGSTAFAAATPPLAAGQEAAGRRSLVERLGYPKDARVLILNGDDFGMNHSTNLGTFEAIKAGGLTSATIMVPCPWFPEVVAWAKENPGVNLGLHLTLTSEWNRYKWGPVAGRSAVPSLVDGLGYLYKDVPDVYEHANLADVEAEVRAQIDRALKAGIDVTHVDSHMGTLQYDPKYHELYIKVAKDYDLPCRIAGPDLMAPLKAEYLIKMADDMNVLHPDRLYLVGPKRVEDTARFWTEWLKTVPPGEVSETFIHCGQETAEMEATSGTWRQRAADAKFFSSPAWLDALKSSGVRLISYRDLRELQRTGKPPAPR